MSRDFKRLSPKGRNNDKITTAKECELAAYFLIKQNISPTTRYKYVGDISKAARNVREGGRQKSLANAPSGCIVVDVRNWCNRCKTFITTRNIFYLNDHQSRKENECSTNGYHC